MAFAAFGGEAAEFVVGIGGGSIVLLVAVDALDSQGLELEQGSSGVTGITVGGVMGT
jgi:hypothetical protein